MSIIRGGRKWIYGQSQLAVDTIPYMLSSENDAILYFIRRDILDKKVLSEKTLWKLPEVEYILKKQQDDGSWRYPSGGTKHLRSKEDYNQLETYQVLGQLVEKYGLNRQHSSIKRAAGYLFGCQSDEGDFKGIYGNQYATTYSPAIMELLVKAGYQDDPHIKNGFRWLLSMRQEDGGWIVPFRTSSKTLNRL